jgi:predicted transcriptional regulator
MQENTQEPMLRAKDNGEGLFIGSRAVSGAMRKLVDDGFVEKLGQNPVIYSITEKGKNIKIED